MPTVAVTCALGAWAAAVAATDLRYRRVPNALLLVLLLPALAVLIYAGRGPLDASPLQSLIGFTIATLALLPGYALGQLGAGDVKFAACLGLLLGAAAAFEMVLVGATLLGLVSAVLILLRRFAAWSVPNTIPATPAFAAAFGLQMMFGAQFV